MKEVLTENIKESRKKILLSTTGNFMYNISTLRIKVKVCNIDSNMFSTSSEMRFTELKSVIAGINLCSVQMWSKTNNFYEQGMIYSI